MPKTLLLALLTCSLLLTFCAACQAAPATFPAPQTATLPVQAATITPAPLTPLPTSTPPAPTGLLPTRQKQLEVVAKAIADLAARLKIEPAAIAIISVTGDDFPAQDLGCASASTKGQPVLPAFVTGLVIRLQAQGQEYEYHAHGGELAFCSPLP